MYREIKTEDRGISTFVKCYWYSETQEPAAHTILPNGYIDLLFECTVDGVQEIKITGIWSKAITIHSPANRKVYGVRFTPLVAEILPNINFRSIGNCTINLSTNIFHLTDISFDSLSLFYASIEKMIHQLISRQPPIRPCKQILFEAIYKQESHTVVALSSQANWAPRQINRYFNATFGIPLKRYLMIVRCNSSYKTMAMQTVAPVDRYFDQAHFIKEIRAFTQQSPQQLMKNENDRFLQFTTLKQQ